MNVYWEDDAKTILVREFPETWLWDEYMVGIQTMRQMLHEVQHDVFVIIDARRIRQVPPGALDYFSEGNRQIPSHVVMRILVTQNRLALLLFSVLMKVMPESFLNFSMVSTLEEAHEKIQVVKESS